MVCIETRHQLSLRLRRPRSGGGFTLIELVMLMVIMGILAAVAVPNLAMTASTRVTTAARQLLRDVSFAREQAILTGNRTWVVFDTAGETYTLLAENPAVPGRIGATPIADPATGRDFIIVLSTSEFPDVEIISASFDGAAEVGFDWRGKPLNDSEVSMVATGSVTLTGAHSIFVRAGTGVAYGMP